MASFSSSDQCKKITVDFIYQKSWLLQQRGWRTGKTLQSAFSNMLPRRITFYPFPWICLQWLVPPRVEIKGQRILSVSKGSGSELLKQNAINSDSWRYLSWLVEDKPDNFTWTYMDHFCLPPISINLLDVWNKVSQKPKSIMALRNQKRLTLYAQLKFSAARRSFGAFHWTLGPLGRRNFVPLHPSRHSPRRPPERSASGTPWTKSPWDKIRPQLVLLCCS